MPFAFFDRGNEKTFEKIAKGIAFFLHL